MTLLYTLQVASHLATKAWEIVLDFPILPYPNSQLFSFPLDWSFS